MSKRKHIADALIETLFERTDFGAAGKTNLSRRGLMVDCVLSRAAGYHVGYTLESICIKAGLLTSKGNVTRAGFRWALDQLDEAHAQSISVTKTLLEELYNN